MKTYKVGIVPGTIVEVGVDDPTITVEALFRLAGLSVASGYTIRRNGAEVTSGSQIGDNPNGSSFYASKMIKGN